MLDELDVERERIIATLTAQRDRAYARIARDEGKPVAVVRLEETGEIAPVGPEV